MVLGAHFSSNVAHVRTVALFTLLTVAAPALAGDGDLAWRTIDTPHFQLHYPRGLEPVADRAARICEEAWRVLTPLVEHAPAQRVQVLLTDWGDSANGSATALPAPHINLLAAPPTLDGNLSDYDDWLRLLVFHEFTHILQLDQISGIPSFLNAFLGRVMAPNHNIPSFQLEGFAVFAESFASGRGRIRSAIFRGLLRVQALAGRLHDIDAVTHAPQDWPGANVWYLYGGHFMDWVVRTRGLAAVTGTYRAFSDEVMPFGLNRASWEASRETYVDQFRAWRAALVGRSEAERTALVSEGLTPYTLVSHDGRRRSTPRFGADGAVLTLEGGRKARGIYRRVPRADAFAEPRVVIELDAARHFDRCPDGTLVFDGTDRQGVYSRTDLFTLRPGQRHGRRITRGARVREPACAPNGLWAAAARIREGRTQLVRVDLHDGDVSLLFDPGGTDQVAFPAISANGRAVVFTLASQTRGRDLYAFDTATGALRRLTHDEALELHPRFSPDGRWLLYGSDRSGVFDVYARPWPEGPARRLTRVIGGATDPEVSPDGRLFFRALGPDGWDLAHLPFTPERGLSPTPPADPPRAMRADAGDARLPDRAYDPTETLWPLAWTPSFSFSNAQDSAASLGIDVEAVDAARQHSVVGSFGTTPEEDALSAGVSYTWRRFLAPLSLSVAHATRSANSAFHGDAPQPFRERVDAASIGTSLPLSRAGTRVSAAGRYSFSATRPAENPDPVHDPLDAATFAPQPSRRGSLSLSLRFGHTDSFAFNVSTERGRTLGLTLRVRHPALGGDFETAEAFADYKEFVPLWWRHVLAFKAVGALGRGDVGRRVFYGLGAPTERNLLLDALDRVFFGSTFLRGYPAGTVTGNRYLLLTAEYRMPLLDLFGGPSMVPLFMRRLKLAAFTDWGQAANQPLDYEPSAFRRSAGAEIITEATLGWRLNFTARAGYAHGFDDDGEGQLYFFLGNWF